MNYSVCLQSVSENGRSTGRSAEHTFRFQSSTFNDFFTRGAVGGIDCRPMHSSLPTIQWITYTAFSADLVLDVSITASLTYFLNRIRSGHTSSECRSSFEGQALTHL
jgi:hypothetical protein